MINRLISQMTLREKIGQLNQPMLGWHVYKKVGDDFELTDDFKMFVEKFGGIGAVYGLFRADPWSGMNYENGILPEKSAHLANKLQKYLEENTRLKIPAFIGEEVPHGHQALDGTVFPVNLGIASSFNNDLHQKAYALLAREVSARGGNLGLASALDIIRDPRWGRSEECYSEDPYLASQFAYSLVKGIQSENKLGAVVKHFCAQGENMGGHNIWPANIGQRELREIHIPPMEGAIKADAMACMAAYGEIDGEPCHSSRKLLSKTLREELGFDGFVMADLGAIDRNTIQTGNEEQAAANAINAGVDLSLCDAVYTKLEQAVMQGLVDIETIDIAVRRVLQAKFKLNLFENRYTNENEYKSSCNTEEIKQVNLELATQSIVMLKNEILPLSKDVKSIAVIGPHIYQPYYQLGDYVASQREGSCITVLDGIKSVFSNTEVYHAQGCLVRNPSKDGFAYAIEQAQKSDVIILTLGGSSAREFASGFEVTGAVKQDLSDNEMDCGEGVDVANLELGGVQQELFFELKKTGKPIIVVLIQGRPYAIPEIKKHADAILCAWYPGQMGGLAIANIISGKSVPSGKLPVSIPVSSAQLPVYYNYKDIGDKPRYVDMTAEPLYQFGYGLSYTTFEYIAISLNPNISLYELEKGSKLKVVITVKNTGKVDAQEVVQLYIRDVQSSITHRIKELKGYKKLLIKAGQTIDVELELGFNELCLYNLEMQKTVEKGKFELMTGSSSKTTIHTIFEVV
jgi:beta-glucosidase